MLGIEELSREDRNTVYRARRLERFLTQPFYVTKKFTGQEGRLVALEDALDGCERILNDEFANLPEQALYMIGPISEAQPGRRHQMRLKVLLPAELLFEEEVSRIRAEAMNGWFGLLPKHIDFVTALVPGVLTFQPCGKPEEYLAIDRGILVKCGSEVAVSTRNAFRGTEPRETEKRSRSSVSSRSRNARKPVAPLKPVWRPIWCVICSKWRNMPEKLPDSARAHAPRGGRQTTPHGESARRQFLGFACLARRNRLVGGCPGPGRRHRGRLAGSPFPRSIFLGPGPAVHRAGIRLHQRLVSHERRQAMTVALCAAAGVALGIFFFGGLWITVQHLPTGQSSGLPGAGKSAVAWRSCWLFFCC